MTKSVLTVLIWIVVLVPASFGVNEDENPNAASDSVNEDGLSSDAREMGGLEAVNEIFNREFIVINGRTMSLGAIYADKKPELRNLKVGNKIVQAFLSQEDAEISPTLATVDSICASNYYTQRTFTQNNPSARYLWTSESEDTPTKIVEDMIESNILRTNPQKPVVIVGNARSGKSVALAKIQTTLSEIMPTVWTIRIDIAEDRYSGLTTLDGVVRQAVGPDFSDLILSVMETNPRRVVLLIDGTDHVTDRRAAEAVSIVNAATARGTLTVLTGRRNILNFFGDVEVQHLIIGEMSFQESEHFLTNAWRSAVESELSLGASTASHRAEVQERLTYYVRALTNTLFKTSLPRQPVTLQVLADLFKDRSTMAPTVLPDYPVTCLDYVFNPSISAPPLVAALENLPLDINILYEKIIYALLRGNSPDLSAKYGILAMAATKEKYRLLKKPLPLPQNLEFSLERVVQSSLENKHHYILIDFTDSTEFKFIYPALQGYYAAKSFLSQFRNPVEQKIALRHIFTHYDANVLEFLNAQVSALPIISKQFEPEFPFRIIRDIVDHGHENLFVYIYDNLDFHFKQRPGFISLTRAAIVDEAFIWSIHKPHKILGMAQAGTNHPNPYAPIESSRFVMSRMRLLIEFNMPKALRLILSFLQGHQHYLNGDALLNAVTRPVPNLQMVKDLMDIVPPGILEADLDRLLYETVDKVGDGCQSVAKYLVERGARPSNAIVDGSTLVHAAVKSNSVNLLRFVVEDLMKVQGDIEDSRDASGQSIFETALDANASPMYTFPGWWEMMDYLTQRLDTYSISTDYPATTDDMYLIPREVIKTAEFQLMFWSTKNYVLQRQYNNVWTMSVYLMERSGRDNEHIESRTRFIPYSKWSFGKNILSLRRYSWLARLEWRAIQTISPLEMLVYFRGTMPLQPAQHMHYRNAVMSLIGRWRDTLNYSVRSRIYSAMWKTVGDERDMADTIYHTMVLGPDISYDRLSWRILREIVDWQVDIREREGRSFMRIRERLMQTRLEYVQGQEMSEGAISMMQNFNEFMNRLNQGGRSLDLLRCVQRRFRRDAQTPCVISWEDVLKFDDNRESREVQEIRVNSDRFLQVLAEAEQSDRVKAYELVGLVRELQLESNAQDLITGSAKMLVRDVLEQGSLSAYRQSRRIADLTGKLWHSSARPRKFMALLPSRTTALYVGSQIPLVHALFAAIDACLQHRVDSSDKRCWYGAGMFGLSVLLGPVGNAAVKYTPRMVDQFSRVALELLPSKAPAFLRENIYMVRNIGLKYGARALSTGLMIVGIGFDIYNIVTMSQAIAECNREPDLCTSRDKAEYIISLTFSCVSIVVTGGLMITGVGIVPAIIIQLHLMVLEHLALGINDAVYYATKYHTTFGETFRIFWQKFLGMSQSSDITALLEHEELIEHLRHQVKKILDDETSKDVIAYAIGVGSLVSGAGIVAGHSIIDMSREDVKNTENLSRVMPQADSDTIRLCLPQEHSTAGYYDYANSVSTAKYRCVNSFVLGHKKRWESGATDRSYIVYDLLYISEGLVMGSSSVNNLFLIHTGTLSLKVVGGNGNVTNNYIIHESSFRGNIQLHNPLSKNTLNLASIESPTLHFQWNYKFHTGTVQTRKDSAFSVYGMNDPLNLHVVGRLYKSESYDCDYTSQADSQTDDGEHSVIIDGNGGESVASMDKIVDCRVSILRPFTHIIGSESPDVTHTARVHLGNVPFRSASSTVAPVVIEPRRSKFIIIFENQSLLANINSVTYNTSSKTVSWNFSYTLTVSMLLSVPLRSESSSSEVNCMIIDSYSGATIYPVIEEPANTGVSTVDVQNLHVFITVNSISLSDVISRYRNLTAFWNSQFFVVTKFTHSPTGKTFVFGSKKSEHFYIDANTTFLYGSDGHDVYVLSQQPPKYVQIDNRATDRALDTLLILESTCDSLFVQRDSFTSFNNYSELDDVTILCATAPGTSSGVSIILRNYLLDPENQHLKIIWNDAVYILLPLHWTQGNNSYSATGRDVELGLVYSFSAHLDALTLTSRNTRYLVLNTTEGKDSLLAYRPPMSNNVLITQKSGDHHSISFVILENFFSADTNYTAVSAEWQHLKIFVTADVDDDEVTPTVLTAQSVQNLIVSTVIEDFIDAATNGDPITEYVVDMTSNASKTTDIQHNSETQSGKHDRLGVLVVIGANPGDFRAEWSTNDSNSLSLCACGSCIVVRNWCLSPRHQLYRWEFIFGLSRRPIVITNLNKLTDCQQRASDTSGLSLVQLNDKLTAAQKHLSLTTDDDDSDRARLIRCVGSIFAYSVANGSIHKLFGFTSSIDHAAFVEKNCHSLITYQNLEQLSLQIMNTTMQNTLLKYEYEFTDNERHSADIILKKFEYLSDICWHNFKYFLYSLYNTNSNQTLVDTEIIFQKIYEISEFLENCV